MFLHSDVLDRGLAVLSDESTALYVCTALPETYAEAVALSIGVKDDPPVSQPGPAISGRRVTIGVITDGLVTAVGLVRCWALVDGDTEKLLAAAPTPDQAVKIGNLFSLDAVDVGIPSPA